MSNPEEIHWDQHQENYLISLLTQFSVFIILPVLKLSNFGKYQSQSKFLRGDKRLYR